MEFWAEFLMYFEARENAAMARSSQGWRPIRLGPDDGIIGSVAKKRRDERRMWKGE
jgi:hypothetical protein